MDIDAVMDKIRKAVRLANRTSEAGERETALRLARGLAERNGISFEEVSADEGDAARAVHEQDEGWQTLTGVEFGHACFILREHFGVIVMSSQYRGKAQRKRLSWFGSRLNIEIAKHVFHILLRESRRAYREANGPARDERILLVGRLAKCGIEAAVARRLVAEWQKGTADSARIDRKSFMSGFFYAISQKLAATPLRNDIAADRAAAERKFAEYREGHDVKESEMRQNRSLDRAAVAQGFAAGRRMNLARPCEGDAASPLAIAL